MFVHVLFIGHTYIYVYYTILFIVYVFICAWLTLFNVYRGSQPQSYCYSYPGINIALKNTSLEQVVSLARGSSGCWDGTQHSLMKYMAIVLGKRNEHQRGDRASSITVNSANVAVAVSQPL